jgi:hypothetical protein
VGSAAALEVEVACSEEKLQKRGHHQVEKSTRRWPFRLSMLRTLSLSKTRNSKSLSQHHGRIPVRGKSE